MEEPLGTPKKVNAYGCCAGTDQFDAETWFCGACCVPCVYGAALTRWDTQRPETLFPDTACECGYLCFSAFVAPIHPCVGAYIRADRLGQNFCYAFLLECFGCLTCAPCQMAQYARSSTISVAVF